MPTMTTEEPQPKKITLGQAIAAVIKFLDRSPEDPKITDEELDLAEEVLIRIQEARIKNLEKKFAHDPVQRDQAISHLITSFVRDLYPQPAP